MIAYYNKHTGGDKLLTLVWSNITDFLFLKMKRPNVTSEIEV